MTEATDLINQANILDVTPPMPPCDLYQIESLYPSANAMMSVVASGEFAGSNVFQTASPLGGPWNGQAFDVFVGSIFDNQYSPDQQLTEMFHELEHPAYSGTDDPDAIDSQKSFDMIASQCQTGQISSGH